MKIYFSSKCALSHHYHGKIISRPMLHFNEMYNKKGVLTILWMYVILLFYVINASPAKRVNYSLEDLLLRIKS